MLDTLIEIGNLFEDCLTIVNMDLPDRPCIYVNKKFEEFTGYKANEVLGKNLKLLQGVDSAEDTIEFMKKAFLQNEACCQDIINYKKDGTAFLNRLVMLPFKNGDQQLYVGFQNDITELKGLTYYNETLKKIDSGNIRHNINNPLTITLASFSLELKRNPNLSKQDFRKKLLSTFERLIVLY